MTMYPPSGSSLHDLFAAAQSSNYTLSGIADKNRHERELRSVATSLTIAQDYTCEVIQNYDSHAMKAHAVWDVITETGEIATAVIVENTSVKQIAHAAESLTRCPSFTPQCFYSDTWPHKEGFWKLVFGERLDGH